MYIYKRQSLARIGSIGDESDKRPHIEFAANHAEVDTVRTVVVRRII